MREKNPHTCERSRSTSLYGRDGKKSGATVRVLARTEQDVEVNVSAGLGLLECRYEHRGSRTADVVLKNAPGQKMSVV